MVKTNNRFTEPRRIVIGVTGASGQIYASRMIEILKDISGQNAAQQYTSLGSQLTVQDNVSSASQQAVQDNVSSGSQPAVQENVSSGLQPAVKHIVPPLEVDIVFTDTARQVFPHETGQPLPEGLIPNDSYYNRNASGSNAPDVFIIIPCTMGTLGRIAAGTSDDLICRIADVQLKERRTLIIVPRETPYSLIHLRNMTTLTEAGAIIAPASPAFYAVGAAAGTGANAGVGANAGAGVNAGVEVNAGVGGVVDDIKGAREYFEQDQTTICQIVTQFIYRILSIANIYPLPEEQRWLFNEE